MRIINELTTGTITYGLDKKDAEQNTLIFDVNGTFDISF